MDIALTAAHRLDAGENIAIIGHTIGHAWGMVEQVVRYIHPDLITTRQGAGAERVDHASGGRLLIMSVRTIDRVRGHALHYAITDDHTPLTDPHFMRTLTPAFATTEGRPRIAVIG